MADPKVYLLNHGSLVIDKSQVLWHIGIGTPVRFPVYSVLIEHADGLVLYDSGFDLGHVQEVLPFELPEQTKEQTLEGQLALVGHKPEDVDILINSHFHFDHVGGNRFLTNAKTVVHKAEVSHLRAPEPFERLGYSDKSFDSTADYSYVSGDDYELMPGIRLFETPGHTAGHYSMLIEMKKSRSMLFAGDAAYTQESLDREIIAGFHLDPVASVESIRRLKYLAKIHDADLYPSHDMESFEKWDQAPKFHGGS
jgi:4-pyridoxolactonase